MGKRYQTELKEARLNQGRVKTQSELAWELKIFKARLTQIMNLLKPNLHKYPL
jgi:hypothetical protein